MQYEFEEFPDGYTDFILFTFYYQFCMIILIVKISSFHSFYRNSLNIPI